MNTPNTILKTTPKTVVKSVVKTAAKQVINTSAKEYLEPARKEIAAKKSDATVNVDRFNTSLHARLISLTEEPAGFAASEVTGYSAAQVRKAAEAMAEAGLLMRWNVSPRRVRYFSNEEQALAFKPAPVTGRVAGPNGGTRMKAGWSADEPGIITPQTKITIAPRLPRNVYRSNTYLKF